MFIILCVQHATHQHAVLQYIAYMPASPTCLHHPHTYITYVHAYITHMHTSPTCLHHLHAYIIYMPTSPTCPHHLHSYITHMPTSPTCLHHLHAYITYMPTFAHAYIMPFCTYVGTIQVCFVCSIATLLLIAQVLLHIMQVLLHIVQWPPCAISASVTGDAGLADKTICSSHFGYKVTTVGKLSVNSSELVRLMIVNSIHQ